MSNIFDMITGTGSGSIVAAGLSYNNGTTSYVSNESPTPAWTAGDAIKFLQTNGKILFDPHVLALWIRIVFGILIALTFLAIGVYLGQKRYTDPKIDKAFDHLDMVISNLKRKAKDRDIKYEEHELCPDGNQVSHIKPLL